ncbi:MAG: hypothetical protein ACYTGL_22305 [Planctomycetota bacterium]
MQHFLSLLLTLAMLTGCSISIGNTASSSFKLSSTGIGTSAAQAERDAWHDAADRLHAMGYSSFDLTRTGLASTGSAKKVEVTADWQVSNAVKGGDGACHCSHRHPDREHNR